MRANKKKPENPVQKDGRKFGSRSRRPIPGNYRGTTTNNPPRLKRLRLSNQPEYLRYCRA